MKFTFKLLTLSLSLSLGMQAQRTCGTPVPPAEWDNWLNQKVAEHKQNVAAGKTQNTNFTVPVIVHVIHGNKNVGTYPNISQAQINSQIIVMNNDFAGIGLNVGNLAATGFSAVGAADCSISFCLAQLDPDGNALTEWGIDRVDFIAHSWADPASKPDRTTFQNYMDGTIKPGTIWDPSRYFNIWVTDHGNGVDLLGYATFPAASGLTGISNSLGNAITDGIWVWAKSFGNTGTLQTPYNKGRTATHEAGHWVGLRHIGGDASNAAGDCNATDYCNDTPPQKGGYSSGQNGQNFGAPSYPLHLGVCPASLYGDMFMNFMDYVDDAYCTMFTPDQSTRMTAAMTNGTYRKFLTASSATVCDVIQSAAPATSFNFPTTGCINVVMQPDNQTSGVPNPTYAWSVLPSGNAIITPNTSTMTPNIKFPGIGTYTVNLVATNSAGTNSWAQVITITECNVGIQNNAMLQNTIQFAPNPSSGIVNIISTSSDNQNLDITINNYLGQYVTAVSFKDLSTNAASFDMSNYSNGVYFVTVDNGHSKTVKRLIISK